MFLTFLSFSFALFTMLHNEIPNHQNGKCTTLNHGQNEVLHIHNYFRHLLTQCASKRDHLRDMKIANFQNLFRGTWGCWKNLLRPKNFGPGRTGRPVRPILCAIFGYFSNFERQKNPIKCSVLTTFLHLGGQLGQLGSHKSKIGLRTATQSE